MRPSAVLARVLAVGALAGACVGPASAWTQKSFVLGTFWDPCLQGTALSDSAHMQQAKDAYFNLLTRWQDAPYLDAKDGMEYALTIASRVGMQYLAADDTPGCPANLARYTSLTGARRSAIYGYNLGDEPSASAGVRLKNCVQRIKAADPTRLAWVNLFPAYAAPEQLGARNYEAYLDTFLTDPNPSRRFDVACFDYYPFLKAGVRREYFYNLDAVARKAAGRPVWTFPMATPIEGYARPLNEGHLVFEASCPIAYGVKGILWFCYEQPGWAHADGIVNDCSIPMPSYATVKRINWYFTKVVGPIVMVDKWLGAFHKSQEPTNEKLGSSQIIASSTPLVADLTNDTVPQQVGLVGIFQSSTKPGTYHLFVVNKMWSSGVTMNVVLQGNRRVWLGPSENGYAGDTAFAAVPASYSSATNRTTVSLPMAPGEGRMLRVESP